MFVDILFQSRNHLLLVAALFEVSCTQDILHLVDGVPALTLEASVWSESVTGMDDGDDLALEMGLVALAGLTAFPCFASPFPPTVTLIVPSALRMCVMVVCTPFDENVVVVLVMLMVILFEAIVAIDTVVNFAGNFSVLQ